MDLNKLVIKSFDIRDVEFNENIEISNKKLNIKGESELKKILIFSKKFNTYIKDISINIVKPEKKDLQINSIMDFIPISTKVLGEIGTGITHTLTGVVVMLTGADENGNQICGFGKSNGILRDVVKYGRVGTPEIDDWIIHIDIEVFKNAYVERACIDCCHEICDIYMDEIREVLRVKNGKDANERHDYIDIPNFSGKKIIILKQVAGQGAMYDTRLFSEEPSGFRGGYSIIDFMNMPIFISKNEYRDGAIRAMH